MDAEKFTSGASLVRYFFLAGSTFIWWFMLFVYIYTNHGEWFLLKFAWLAYSFLLIVPLILMYVYMGKIDELLAKVDLYLLGLMTILVYCVYSYIDVQYKQAFLISIAFLITYYIFGVFKRLRAKERALRQAIYKSIDQNKLQNNEV